VGLDITAYQGLKEDADKPMTDDYDYDTHVRFWSNSDFPKHIGEKLKERTLYTFQHRLGFRAGSYSGYNQWREGLAKLIGTTCGRLWDNPQPGPFVELLNFSDCEGTIGPELCAKLYRDFVDHKDKAEKHEPYGADTEANAWWVENYNHWLHAFEMGMQDGAVDFH